MHHHHHCSQGVQILYHTYEVPFLFSLKLKFFTRAPFFHIMLPMSIVFCYNKNQSHLKLHLYTYTAQKTVHLVTFTEEIPHGKLHILCSENRCFTIITKLVTKPNKNALSITFKDNPTTIYLFKIISRSILTHS